MANKKDCVALLQNITAANPHAKFHEHSAAAWVRAFKGVPRLKLFEVVQEFIKYGSQFTPTIFEIQKTLDRFNIHHPDWTEPTMPEDERALWYMVTNGIDDPYELTDSQVRQFYDGAAKGAYCVLHDPDKSCSFNAGARA